MEAKKAMDNVIRCRVDQFTFKKVMAIAYDTNTSMSDVVRLCVTFSLDKVSEVLKESNKLRRGVPPNG